MESEQLSPVEGEHNAAVAGADLVGALHTLGDVEVTARVEMGRRTMTINEALMLTPGSIIQLDRQADAPLDVYFNGYLAARGEVVVVDNEFGLRITEVLSDGAGDDAV